MAMAEHQVTSGSAVAIPKQAVPPESGLQVVPSAAVLNLGGPKEGSITSISRKVDPQLLHSLVSQGNIDEVRLAIQQRADVNFCDATHPPLLHSAVEAGGPLDMISLLIQAKSQVNAAGRDGRTPLHVAVTRYQECPLMSVRLLLCSQASLDIPDAQGVTSFDCAKNLAVRAASMVSVNDTKLLQLLNELTERHTLDVHVVEGQEVLGACFADCENDKIVYFSLSTVGLYSVTQKRTLYKNKLSSLRLQSEVRQMVVNVEMGTIAVFLEMNLSGQAKNLIIVWATGRTHGEEPLKLHVESDSTKEKATSPLLYLSNTAGPSTLLSRLCDGQVLCWCLNNCCSQLVSEFRLADRGGHLALSGNGLWMAVDDTKSHVEVWSFEGPNGVQQFPEQVTTIERRPRCMAMIQHDGPSCYLALTDDAGLAPIDVLLVQHGSVTAVTCIRAQSPCDTLGFCHRMSGFLYCRHADGCVVVCDLQQGKMSLCGDDTQARSTCVSTDRKLLVTAVGECFRIHRVPPDGA